MRKLVLAGLLLIAGAASAQTYNRPQIGTSLTGNTLTSTRSDGAGSTVTIPGSNCFATTGIVSGCKVWVDTVTTTTGGLFSDNFAAAGFTAVPRVRVQAIAPGTTPSQAYEASVTMPTQTGVSGLVVVPASTTVTTLNAVVSPFAAAPSGVPVQITAIGP